MSKSRRRPTRSRKISTSRAAPRRKATAPPRKAVATRGRKVVTLKPLYAQIGRTVDQLHKLPPSDRVRLAIERLTQCRADFANICGPTMDIPVDGMPNA